jgi:hypothetical protein
MPVQEVLGTAPDHSLTWADLVMGDGIPQGLVGVDGLYAVFVSQRLSYVGRSKNLCFRLGQLVAALCGSTGDGITRGHHVAWGWEYPADAELRFEVFKGASAYEKERLVIARHRPPFNRR